MNVGLAYTEQLENYNLDAHCCHIMYSDKAFCARPC